MSNIQGVLDGERACPPEDCGGQPGYYELLDTLKLPKQSKKYRELVDWLQRTPRTYPYKPENFNPSKVFFDNPKERLKDIELMYGV